MLNAILYLALLTLSTLVVFVAVTIPCLLLQRILYGIWLLISGKEISKQRKTKMHDNLFLLASYNIFKRVLKK